MQRKMLTQRAAASSFSAERLTLPRQAEDDHMVVNLAWFLLHRNCSKRVGADDCKREEALGERERDGGS